jgi:Rad3-related DNA helicase
MANNLPATDYENISEYFPFDTKRYGQDEILAALQKYLEDPKIKYIILEASTGLGKSPLAIAAALAAKSAYIATANKFLQDQYLRDFSDYMVDLKGRGNYKCNSYEVPDGLKDKIGEFYNCTNSPCQQSLDGRSDCSKKRCCEYHKQLIKASEADVTSFNFASALAFLNYLSKQFKKRNLLVCDEAHNIPNWVTNFISVDFSLSILKELGLQTFIPDHPTVEEYSEYLVNIQITVNRLLENEKALEANVVSRLDTLQKRFVLFDAITNDKRDMGNFVTEKTYDINDKYTIQKISFKPVVISKIVNDYLFRHANKTLLMSATILDFKTYMEMMGIDKKECAIIRVPSIFPVSNRPIFTRYNVGYINQKNLDNCLPNIISMIESLLDMYPDVKGIIHSVTYKIANYIYDNIKSKRILYPKTASEQKEIIETHTKSENPTILLSPSMTEGVDLFDDNSRLQIIVKMPYAYLGDPVIKRRMEIYEGYYNMLTALAITQAYGRSVRSQEDHCHTYILDRCFSSFIRANGHILQSSFIEAINY